MADLRLPYSQALASWDHDGVLSSLADDVVIRVAVQRGVVVIPKSVRAERMRKNIDVFDSELSEDEMRRVAGLDTGETLFFDHRDPEMVSRLGAVRVG